MAARNKIFTSDWKSPHIWCARERLEITVAQKTAEDPHDDSVYLELVTQGLAGRILSLLSALFGKKTTFGCHTKTVHAIQIVLSEEQLSQISNTLKAKAALPLDQLASELENQIHTFALNILTPSKPLPSPAAADDLPSSKRPHPAGTGVLPTSASSAEEAISDDLSTADMHSQTPLTEQSALARLRAAKETFEKLVEAAYLAGPAQYETSWLGKWLDGEHPWLHKARYLIGTAAHIATDWIPGRDLVKEVSSAAVATSYQAGLEMADLMQRQALDDDQRDLALLERIDAPTKQVAEELTRLSAAFAAGTDGYREFAELQHQVASTRQVLDVLQAYFETSDQLDAAMAQCAAQRETLYQGKLDLSADNYLAVVKQAEAFAALQQTASSSLNAFWQQKIAKKCRQQIEQALSYQEDLAKDLAEEMAAELAEAEAQFRYLQKTIAADSAQQKPFQIEDLQALHAAYNRYKAVHGSSQLLVKRLRRHQPSQLAHNEIYSALDRDRFCLLHALKRAEKTFAKPKLEFHASLAILLQRLEQFAPPQEVLTRRLDAYEAKLAAQVKAAHQSEYNEQIAPACAEVAYLGQLAAPLAAAHAAYAQLAKTEAIKKAIQAHGEAAKQLMQDKGLTYELGNFARNILKATLLEELKEHLAAENPEQAIKKELAEAAASSNPKMLLQIIVARGELVAEMPPVDLATEQSKLVSLELIEALQAAAQQAKTRIQEYGLTYALSEEERKRSAESLPSLLQALQAQPNPQSFLLGHLNAVEQQAAGMLAMLTKEELDKHLARGYTALAYLGRIAPLLKLPDFGDVAPAKNALIKANLTNALQAIGQMAAERQQQKGIAYTFDELYADIFRDTLPLTSQKKNVLEMHRRCLDTTPSGSTKWRIFFGWLQLWEAMSPLAGLAMEKAMGIKVKPVGERDYNYHLAMLRKTAKTDPEQYAHHLKMVRGVFGMYPEYEEFLTRYDEYLRGDVSYHMERIPKPTELGGGADDYAWLFGRFAKEDTPATQTDSFDKAPPSWLQTFLGNDPAQAAWHDKSDWEKYCHYTIYPQVRDHYFDAMLDFFDSCELPYPSANSTPEEQLSYHLSKMYQSLKDTNTASDYGVHLAQAKQIRHYAPFSLEFHHYLEARNAAFSTPLRDIPVTSWHMGKAVLHRLEQDVDALSAYVAQVEAQVGDNALMHAQQQLVRQHKQTLADLARNAPPAYSDDVGRWLKTVDTIRQQYLDSKMAIRSATEAQKWQALISTEKLKMYVQSPATPITADTLGSVFGGNGTGTSLLKVLAYHLDDIKVRIEALCNDSICPRETAAAFCAEYLNNQLFRETLKHAPFLDQLQAKLEQALALSRTFTEAPDKFSQQLGAALASLEEDESLFFIEESASIVHEITRQRNGRFTLGNVNADRSTLHTHAHMFAGATHRASIYLETPDVPLSMLLSDKLHSILKGNILKGSESIPAAGRFEQLSSALSALFSSKGLTPPHDRYVDKLPSTPYQLLDAMFRRPLDSHESQRWVFESRLRALANFHHLNSHLYVEPAVHQLVDGASTDFLAQLTEWHEQQVVNDGDLNYALGSAQAIKASLAAATAKHTATLQQAAALPSLDKLAGKSLAIDQLALASAYVSVAERAPQAADFVYQAPLLFANLTSHAFPQQLKALVNYSKSANAAGQHENAILSFHRLVEQVSALDKAFWQSLIDNGQDINQLISDLNELSHEYLWSLLTRANDPYHPTAAKVTREDYLTHLALMACVDKGLKVQPPEPAQSQNLAIPLYHPIFTLIFDGQLPHLQAPTPEWAERLQRFKTDWFETEPEKLSWGPKYASAWPSPDQLRVWKEAFADFDEKQPRASIFIPNNADTTPYPRTELDWVAVHQQNMRRHLAEDKDVYLPPLVAFVEAWRDFLNVDQPVEEWIESNWERLQPIYQQFLLTDGDFTLRKYTGSASLPDAPFIEKTVSLKKNPMPKPIPDVFMPLRQLVIRTDLMLRGVMPEEMSRELFDQGITRHSALAIDGDGRLSEIDARHGLHVFGSKWEWPDKDAATGRAVADIDTQHLLKQETPFDRYLYGAEQRLTLGLIDTAEPVRKRVAAPALLAETVKQIEGGDRQATKLIRQLLALSSIKEVQVSETLNFYTRHKDLLNNPDHQQLLKCLLLEPGVLPAELQKHPADNLRFATTLAFFFSNSIEFYEYVNDMGTASYLLSLNQQVAAAVAAHRETYQKLCRQQRADLSRADYFTLYADDNRQMARWLESDGYDAATAAELMDLHAAWVGQCTELIAHYQKQIRRYEEVLSTPADHGHNHRRTKEALASAKAGLQTAEERLEQTKSSLVENENVLKELLEKNGYFFFTTSSDVYFNSINKEKALRLNLEHFLAKRKILPLIEKIAAFKKQQRDCESQDGGYKRSLVKGSLEKGSLETRINSTIAHLSNLVGQDISKTRDLLAKNGYLELTPDAAHVPVEAMVAQLVQCLDDKWPKDFESVRLRTSFEKLNQSFAAYKNSVQARDDMFPANYVSPFIENRQRLRQLLGLGPPEILATFDELLECINRRVAILREIDNSFTPVTDKIEITNSLFGFPVEWTSTSRRLNEQGAIEEESVRYLFGLRTGSKYFTASSIAEWTAFTHEHRKIPQLVAKLREQLQQDPVFWNYPSANFDKLRDHLSLSTLDANTLTQLQQELTKEISAYKAKTHKPDTASLLYSRLALSYAPQKDLSLFDAQELLHAAIAAQAHDLPEKLFSRSEKVALHAVLRDKQPQLADLLDKYPQALLNGVYQRFRRGTEAVQWRGTFPVFSSADGRIEIDVLAGKLYFDADETGYLAETLQTHPLYTGFFGAATLTLRKQRHNGGVAGREVYQTTDSQGHAYRLIAEGDDLAIQRQYNGQWYQLMHAEEEIATIQAKLPAPLTAGFHYWHYQDEIFLSDTATNSASYLISRGSAGCKVAGEKIWLIDGGKTSGHVLADPASCPLTNVLARSEDPRYMLIQQEAKSGLVKRLQLPRLGLSFDIEQSAGSTRAISHELDGYELSELQHTAALGSRTDYLLLAKKTNSGDDQKIAIVPFDLQPDGEKVPTGYLAYELIRTADQLQLDKLRPTTDSAALFLARSCLQAHDYAQAFKWLKRYEHWNRPLDRDSMRILTAFTALDHDAHPRAVAVKLKAMALLIRQKFDFKNSAVSLDSDQLLEDYTTYLQVQRPQELISLSRHDERLILEQCAQMMDPTALLQQRSVLLRKRELGHPLTVAQQLALGTATTMQSKEPGKPVGFSAINARSYFPLLTEEFTALYHALSKKDSQVSTYALGQAAKPFIGSRSLSLFTSEEILKALDETFLAHLAGEDEAQALESLLLKAVMDHPEKFPESLGPLEGLKTDDSQKQWIRDNLTHALRDVALADETLRQHIFGTPVNTPLAAPQPFQAPVLSAFQQPMPLEQPSPYYDVPAMTLSMLSLRKVMPDAAASAKNKARQKELHQFCAQKVRHNIAAKELAALQTQFDNYYASGATLQPTYEIIDRQAFAEGQSRLAARTRKLEAELLAMKDAIEALANKLPADGGQQDVRKAQLLSGKVAPLSLQECILQLLLPTAEQTHQRNPALTIADIRLLRRQTMDFLMLATEKHQLDALLKLSQDEASLQKLGTEIQRLRAYKSEERPEFLLLDHAAKFWLTGAQVDAIKQAIESGDRDRLLQLIMGFGKTSMMIPGVSFLTADGHKLSMTVLPSELIESMMDEYQNKINTAFNQVLQAINYDRNSPADASYLAHLVQNFAAAIKDKQAVLISKESLAALYLKLSETLHVYQKAQESDPATPMPVEVLRCFQQLFTIIKENGHVTFDEIHNALASGKSTHYTMGKARKLIEINEVIGQTIIDFYRFIQENPSLLAVDEKLSPATSNDTQPFFEDAYHRVTKPKLIQAVVNGQIKTKSGAFERYLSELSADERGHIIDFLYGRMDEKTLSFTNNIGDPKIQDALALYYQIINSLYPETAPKNRGEHYGAEVLDDKGTTGVLAAPRENGIATPAGTQFGEEIVIIAYSLLNHETTVSMVKAEISQLKTASLQELQAGSGATSFEETAAGKQWRELIGDQPAYQLFALNEEDFEPLTALINQNPANTYYFFAKYALPEIEVYDTQLDADSQVYGMLFAKMLGLTGTAANAKSLPPMEVTYSATAAKTFDLLFKHSPKKVDIVHKPSNATPAALHATMLEFMASSTAATSLLDAGGVFSGIPNEAVAKQLYTVCQEKGWDCAVAGFYSATGKIMGVTKDAQGHWVIDELAKMGLSEKGRVFYWNQAQTTGSDIKLPPTMTAVVSVNRHAVLDNQMQAYWRLRGLADEQLVRLAITPADEKIVRLTLEKELAQPPTGEIALQELLLYFVITQAYQQGTDNYRSFNQKQHALLREKAFSAMLKVSPEEMPGIYAASRALFETTRSLRPYEMYARPLVKVPKADAIKRGLDAFLDGAIVKDFLAHPLLGSLWTYEDIKRETELLQERECENLPDEIASANEYGKMRTVQTQKQQTTQTQKQQQVNTRKQRTAKVNQLLEETDAISQTLKLTPPLPVKPWPKHGLFTKDYFKHYNAPEMSLVLATNPDLHDIFGKCAHLFDYRLRCSNNLCPVDDNGGWFYDALNKVRKAAGGPPPGFYSPFSPRQLNCNQVLLIQSREHRTIYLLMISPDDEMQFRQMLIDASHQPKNEHRIRDLALYDLQTGLYLKSGGLEIDSKTQILIVQAKFFKGEVNYFLGEKNALQVWLEGMSRRELLDLKQLFENAILPWSVTTKEEFDQSYLAKLFAELSAKPAAADASADKAATGILRQIFNFILEHPFYSLMILNILTGKTKFRIEKR